MPPYGKTSVAPKFVLSSFISLPLKGRLKTYPVEQKLLRPIQGYLPSTAARPQFFTGGTKTRVNLISDLWFTKTKEINFFHP